MNDNRITTKFLLLIFYAYKYSLYGKLRTTTRFAIDTNLQSKKNLKSFVNIHCLTSIANSRYLKL